ncbi:MAG: MFS transporter [Chitinophagaceae bacterium]|nr:MFS transporter [Chitinophagaceae bacterium]
MDNKKEIRAWTFYDWANSAYSLIITSAIFPAYYTSIVPNKVHFFGAIIEKTALASYTISFSFLLIAFLSPLLSVFADRQGNKKKYLKFFCYLGSISCMLLFFFVKKDNEVNIYYGLFFSMLASVGYCGSIVFYNAYLPEIASKKNQDKVSANGFAMGYIGSVLLMIFCLAFIILNEKNLWVPADIPARVSFILVGIWWLGFAQIPFSVLKDKNIIVENNSNSVNYKSIFKTFKNILTQKNIKHFLLSFFFYNMGVQTVMYMATYFASDELKMETTQLITVVLIIQLVAIGGAFLFSKLSAKIGNIPVLLTLILIWIGICIASYFVKSIIAFYELAFVVGLVMGGIQSLSRSTYSKLLNEVEDTSTYFSLYDVSEKLGIVIGTLTYGIVAQFLGGLRNASLALSIYFLLGFILLMFLHLKIKKNKYEITYH